MATATDQARVDKVIAFARAQIGKPYVFGSAGPNTWDCSGLCYRAYQTVGINTTRTTFTIVKQGRAVRDIAHAQPGDLILPHPGHVQLYIGNGRVIEAYDEGYPVRESKVSRVWRIRRFLSDGLTGSGGTGTAAVTATETKTNDTESGASITDALSALSDPHTWFRIGMFLAGALAIIVGLLSVVKGNT